MNPTERFTDRASAYVLGRPSYPDAAVDALFAGLGDPAQVTAADLGAGTGISSRLLAARGAQVFAVEPNAAMRAAATPDPRVVWLDATAEATGLDEAEVDLVTVFQAFHWFEHAHALREMIRILRPGGRAAVVYNERDESDPFTAAYGAIVRRYQTDDTEARRSDGLAAFLSFHGWHEPQRLSFPNEHVLDRDGVLARARSTSYLPHTGAASDELEAALVETFERFAADGRVTMRIATIVATGEGGGDGG